MLYAKMLKGTESEETMLFFVEFLSVVAFRLMRPGPSRPPPGYPYVIHIQRYYSTQSLC